MSGDVATGSTRPRPLSGGFWNLLSWLRGDEHSTSNESISSAGSDHTAISFAFLPPAHYRTSPRSVVLSPPCPPTDSYKKRVRDRSIRRFYDRDITLHRKYGLIKGESVSSFEAHSLPPVRRTADNCDREERDRRATSECFQRRSAHVPGKRRAPLPPTRSILRINAPGPSTSITRRHTRKRPAPQPPNLNGDNTKENLKSDDNKNTMNIRSTKCVDNIATETKIGCKIKKCSDQQCSSVKNTKIGSDKNFLRQIFENRKRNSSVDTSSVKILPNISELDKQAAEMIETSKLKNDKLHSLHTLRTGDVWYCIKCSKQYNNSTDTCPVCQVKESLCISVKIPKSQQKPIANAATNYTQTDTRLSQDFPTAIKNIHLDEKQKLREMLKEMKDSLPKRLKVDDIKTASSKQEKIIISDDCSELNNLQIDKKNNLNISNLETPTLKIGSGDKRDLESSKKSILNEISYVSQHPKDSSPETSVMKISGTSKISDKVTNAVSLRETSKTNTERKRLQTPLKISSLLNPIYIPKSSLQDDLIVKQTTSTLIHKSDDVTTKQNDLNSIYIKTGDIVKEILNSTAASNSNGIPKVEISNITFDKDKLLAPNNHKTEIERLNQHSRRRDLVIRLEKSIANGDERSAAEAAMKLAQLRLSCSVLSFSSKVVEQPSTSSASILLNNDNNVSQNKARKAPSQEHSVAKELMKQYCQSDVMSPVNINVKNKKGTDTKNASTDCQTQTEKRREDINLISQNSPNSSTPKTSNADKTVPVFTNEVKCKVRNEKSNNVASVRARQEKKERNNINRMPIEVWVEDKIKAHGPIPFNVHPEAVVGDLRQQAETTLGLPAQMQRWIVGRELCNNDKTPLVDLAGTDFRAPFYLCLVECDKKVQEQVRTLCQDKKKASNVPIGNKVNESSSDVYRELVELEQKAIVPNSETFECEICMENCLAGEGVVLRECVHSFCRSCLVDVIRHCEEPGVSCPAIGCPGLLHEREIRALVSTEEYGRWLDRGLAAAESGTKNAFHCRTRDCTGWALCEVGVRRFPCPVCKHTNCVPCQAIHEGETCEQYHKKLQEATATSTSEIDAVTNALIQSLISRGEALQCPECNAIITKKWGCDWVKCSACKTEICWVTRGRRWGPAGRGDTSGGCRCGVDGKRCHPSCGYCH